ncbi:hypothetical protein Ddc_10457 [Ditylenchus destructor]|nr:hypothetical protein Ddc_10457 [Ditylenchus destructor]
MFSAMERHSVLPSIRDDRDAAPSSEREARRAFPGTAMRIVAPGSQETVVNRTEMVIVTRKLGYLYTNQEKVNYIGYFLMSEKSGDYEVLQALRQKVEIWTDNSDGYCVYYITNPSESYDTWMDIELTLRSFGFVQELYDETFGHWTIHGIKFVRSVN